MSVPDLATVVIACPHCGTRYQVARATLGTSGREVQCAHCQKAWQARPDEPMGPDTMFDAAEESALDQNFEAAAREAAAPPPPGRDAEHERTLAEIRAAIAPKAVRIGLPEKAIDPALMKKSRRAFAKRLEMVNRRLPIARLRSAARLTAFGLLIVMLVGGYTFRIDIVRAFPALADSYAAIGLAVNVVGLEFGDATTLVSLRAGHPVVQVSAKIRSIAPRLVAVPPVLVSLLDANGLSIYGWSVIPKARDLAPGESVDFTTEVASPPPGATSVRLTFTTARAASATPNLPPTAAMN